MRVRVPQDNARQDGRCKCSDGPCSLRSKRASDYIPETWITAAEYHPHMRFCGQDIGASRVLVLHIWPACCLGSKASSLSLEEGL